MPSQELWRELNLNTRIVASESKWEYLIERKLSEPFAKFKEKYRHNNNTDRVKRDPIHNNSVCVDTLMFDL